SAVCATSGSAPLLPAARTTLQCVEGNKSFWPHPFPASSFTVRVCIKIAEETQAAKKLKFRAARAPESLCKGKELLNGTKTHSQNIGQTQPKQPEEIKP